VTDGADQKSLTPSSTTSTSVMRGAPGGLVTGAATGAATGAVATGVDGAATGVAGVEGAVTVSAEGPSEAVAAGTSTGCCSAKSRLGVLIGTSDALTDGVNAADWLDSGPVRALGSSLDLSMI